MAILVPEGDRPLLKDGYDAKDFMNPFSRRADEKCNHQEAATRARGQ